VLPYTIDDAIGEPLNHSVEVTIDFGGRKRWLFFTTPQLLASVGDQVEGTRVRMHLGEMHMVVVSELSSVVIDAVLRQLHVSGELEGRTVPLGSQSAEPTTAELIRSSAEGQMAVVRIDCDRIIDWESFHDVFAEALGFPGFYGRNMNAWIDCLTSLDDPADGMTAVHAPPGGVLVLELAGMDGFARRCPEQYEAVVECAAFVNWRRLQVGEREVLALAFYKRAEPAAGSDGG